MALLPNLQPLGGTLPRPVRPALTRPPEVERSAVTRDPVHRERGDELSGITDWYISEDSPENTLVFPGGHRVPANLAASAAELRRLAMAACYRTDDSGRVIEILQDYRIHFRDSYLRGHRQRTVDGILHILRVTSSHIPDSRKLGMPLAVRNILCSPEMGDVGGLVIFCGQPGHGKSTSCAAIIMDRVKQYGSFCLAVEDPPEYPLSGDYSAQGGKSGKVIQVHARERSFSDDLRDALRCYPSNSRGSLLLVGEVRDADCAVQVLRAAGNGQLVFMTTHAGDPVMAIERLLSLANGLMKDPKEASALLASSVRAVIHQRLQDGKLTVTPLFSMRADSVVASTIRNGDPRLLSTELNHQQVRLSLGTLENYVLDGSSPQRKGDR